MNLDIELFNWLFLCFIYVSVFLWFFLIIFVNLLKYLCVNNVLFGKVKFFKDVLDLNNGIW